MQSGMNITILDNPELYNDNKGLGKLKAKFIAMGGDENEFEALEIVHCQLIAYVPIENASFPEARFGYDYGDPSIILEDNDAFLANRVALGFVSVPNGEDISHQEVLYYNSPLDFPYQAPGAVEQYKAIEALYKLEFSLYNNNRQVEFHGSCLKKVPEHRVRGQLHYPEGIFHHLPSQVLFKGTEVMKFKAENHTSAEIDSLPGDKNAQKMYAAFHVGGLRIRRGSEALAILFKSLEKNYCIQ
ncbi:MAG: hypothetical protein ACRBFS_19375 [Aureispira sp.]